MPLARIITRSQVCSQELALDLLARGYAVEIVSPDRIPDNIADLELRVDADPSNQLTASVEAHGDKGSASLDFVHHLRAPMAQFVRRPFPPAEAVQAPVHFNAEPSMQNIDIDMAFPAPRPNVALNAVSQAAPTASAAPAVPAAKGPHDPEPVIRRQVPLLTPAVTPPARPELPSYPASYPNPSTVREFLASVPARARSLRHRLSQQLSELVSELPVRLPKAWSWSAAVVFGGIMLLAAALWFGVRQTSMASAQLSSTAAAQAAPAPEVKTAPPTAAKSIGNPGQMPDASPAAKPTAATPQIATTQISTPPMSTTKVSTIKPRVSSRHSDGYVARDTVIYLDKRAAELAKHSAGQYSSSRKIRDGVIAANSVTYFNNKPAPKTVTTQPATKPASNPN